MPYELCIVLGIFLVVLLVPLLVEVKDRWAGVSILVKSAGVPYLIRGRKLQALMKNLQASSGCLPAHTQALIRRYGTVQLERDQAWEILADLKGVTVEEYLLFAVGERIIVDVGQVPARYRTDEFLFLLNQGAEEFQS
jgi:hypothetical protein